MRPLGVSNSLQRYCSAVTLSSETYMMLRRHRAGEEEVGDGGEDQAAGGDEQAHPPGADPAGVAVSHLLLGSCRTQQ